MNKRDLMIQHIKKLKDDGFKAHELLAKGYRAEDIWEVFVDGILL